ncbi:MAG: FAD-dependent oxidoreductase [Deltaproteobacteria bacterium]|nr:FAD-dependent oxidoreductase [Deltaproteobacteria bacterium]
MKWICNVCGYEHEGDAPPDECPVCGAGPDEFDRVDDAKPPSTLKTMQQTPQAMAALRCALCDHDLNSTHPSCPQCSARTAILSPSRPSFPAAREGKRFVVLGGGVAGWTAAERIRALDPNASITLVTREPCVPYYRLSLTRYLGGELESTSLLAHSPAWWADHQIDVLLEADVVQVDRARREVRTSRGSLGYDRLVAANGARPFMPPLKNALVHGVTAIRSLADARFVLEHAARDAAVAVVGGGILGLESAFALARRGCRVTVVEGAKQLLGRQLDATAAAMFQAHLEKKGIRFVLGDMPAEVLGDETARALKLSSGAEVEADLVIVSAGVRPNTLLWQKAGLRVERGVVVDDSMVTSDPDIFAAGDVAEHKGVVYGIWPAAMEMGRVAGSNAAGGSESFPGLPMSHTLKVVDLDVFSIGALVADRDTMTEVVRPVQAPGYAKLVIDSGVVVGAILMGDTSLSGTIKAWVLQKRDVSSMIASGKSPEEIFASLAPRA